MYYLKRLLFLFPVLLVISFLTFALLRIAPGGPFDRERAPASEEIRRMQEAKYHLDKPFLVQYGIYVRDLFGGDLGPSTQYRDHSINDIVASALPVSLTLGLLAFCFAQGIGIPLGFYTAVKRGQWGDYIGSFIALLAFCIPSLVIGPLLIMIFALKLGWLPPALWETPVHVILPTIALGLYYGGRVARLLREGMTEVLKQPFIIAARAKGLSETKLLWKHALRLGILPVVSYSGPMLADVLVGSFVIESAFGLPGIGIFVVTSVQNRDYAMTMSLTLLYAVLLLVMNLLVDFLYTVLDPRVKYE
ncbi:MAG TPA: ABC transporter permease [Candidatus Acidoferrum sp.]|nr:ABC transporter permease [Candidatus Acidoferrum sp.]